VEWRRKEGRRKERRRESGSGAVDPIGFNFFGGELESPTSHDYF